LLDLEQQSKTGMQLIESFELSHTIALKKADINIFELWANQGKRSCFGP